MDENLHNIETLFHSALEDHEEIPSSNVWNAVDKRLDKDNIIRIQTKYANLKKLVALLLFLIFSFALYEINTASSNKESAKNNHTGHGNMPDKMASSIKTTANAGVAPGTAGTEDNKKTNARLYPSRYDQETSADTKQAIPDKPQPEKQNIAALSTWEKRANEKTASFIPKKKRITAAAYRTTITGTNPSEDEVAVAAVNAELVNAVVSSKETDRPVGKIKSQQKDSMAAAGISPITISRTNMDTAKKAAAKSAREKQGNTSRLSIIPFYSPDIAWYRLQNDKVGNQADDADELAKEEKHEYSYTAGALVEYKINDHWSLQSGLTFSNTNITLEPKTIYAQPDNTGNIKYRINTSSGYGYVLPSFNTTPGIGDSLYAFTSTHSLQYIGVPLAVAFYATTGNFRIKAMAGAAVNILTRARLETTLEEGFNNSFETVNSLYGLKKICFSGLTGLGVDYKLSKKTSLSFFPTLRFALNSINKDATVKSYPMSLSFAAGVKIQL
jgi:hypothetical protein